MSPATNSPHRFEWLRCRAVAHRSGFYGDRRPRREKIPSEHLGRVMYIRLWSALVLTIISSSMAAGAGTFRPIDGDSEKIFMVCRTIDAVRSITENALQTATEQINSEVSPATAKREAQFRRLVTLNCFRTAPSIAEHPTQMTLPAIFKNWTLWQCALLSSSVNNSKVYWSKCAEATE